MKLSDHLRCVEFGLHMSCSFFGYFAHAGALLALEEAGLKPRSVGGSSAGAVVAAILAAGYHPDEMLDLFSEIGFGDIFSFRPRLYWGSPGLALFQQNLDAIEERVLKNKPQRLEECKMPVSLTVQDVTTGKGRVLKTGRIAPAVAASAAVPILMHPIKNTDDGHLFLDGGLSGDMLGVAGADPKDHILVINLFLRAFVPKTPHHLTKAVVVDLYGVPFVTPNALHTTGPIAHKKAYEAMKLALESELPTPRSEENNNNEGGKARRISVKAPSSTEAASAPAFPSEPTESIKKKAVIEEEAQRVSPSDTVAKPASWFDLWRS